MCGIISGKVFKFDKSLFEKIRNLFLESSIRGMHATGISFLKNEKCYSYIEPASSIEFFNNEENNKVLKKVIKCKYNFIGHVRYSTSDILYNQPINIEDNLHLVHNGVITQKNFEFWKKSFSKLLAGYKLKTKNDSELLGVYLKKHFQGKIKNNVFGYFKKSSIACSVLYKNNIYFFRNGKRPLYYYKDDYCFLIASTEDIFLRSGFDKKNIKEVKPFILYRFGDGKIYKKKYDNIKLEDWQ